MILTIAEAKTVLRMAEELMESNGGLRGSQQIVCYSIFRSYPKLEGDFEELSAWVNSVNKKARNGELRISGDSVLTL